MAFVTILRAAFGYLFLVLIVRIVGRRPGKQLTPFEFVLVFYLGGLTLTGMVGPDMSLTNAVCQIITVAGCHYALSWLRLRSKGLARLLDGTPLVLFYQNEWRPQIMRSVRVQDDDVMDMAREQGIRDLGGIRGAVLETTGSITILPAEKSQGEPSDNPENRG